jgi:hypothetical protein
MPGRAKRKTATQAGYGPGHQRERARWQVIVQAGQAYCQAPVCVMPDRWIPPGTSWDLGHTPSRTGYRGPEHSRCNRREGAIIGNRSPLRKARRRRIREYQLRTSRQW